MLIEMDGEKPLIGGGTKVMPNVYIGKNSVVLEVIVLLWQEFLLVIM